MASVLKLRRGNRIQNNAFTGAEGELSYDSTAKKIRVHDGITLGGKILASEIVSVKDFGAVGDGVTDDTVAIQAALDLVGTINFPIGIYAISSTLNLKSNQRLNFLNGSSIIPLANSLTIFSNSTSAFFSQVFNATVNGNGKTGIIAFNLTNYRVGATLYRPQITECDIGIQLNTGCWDLVIDQPTIRNTDKPMLAQIYGGSLQIRYPAIDTFGAIGIKLFKVVGQDTTSVMIQGGYIQGGAIGIQDAGYRTQIIGTYFERCTDVDIDTLNAQYPSYRDTTHLGTVGIRCFRGRNVSSGLINNPWMASGARSSGVFDYDGTNDNCRKQVIASNVSMNTPLGVITGIESNLTTHETGTFIPIIVGSTAAGTGTYSAQVGYYTKIGNTVIFSLSVTWTAHNGTGAITITGLPFLGWVNTPGTFPCEVLDIATVKPYCGQLSNSSLGLRDVSGAGVISLVSIAAAGTILCSGSLILV